ncbi:MAG: pilus assembly protein N-terminal domain-containing protein [Candidatus Omnitrophica bacterium]|nr:pilus assembly protein N-terminal domain-containing protein [Candidatus Omnitrophota bacterium]
MKNRHLSFYRNWRNGVVIGGYLLCCSATAQAEPVGVSGFQAERDKALDQAAQQAMQSLHPFSPAPAVSTAKIIRLPLGSSTMIERKSIHRFLITQPDLVSVEQTSPAALKLTGQKLGTALLHLWEENQRFSYKIQVITQQESKAAQVQPAEPSRKEGKKARPFRVSYDLNHNTFHRGNSSGNLSRSTLNVSQHIQAGGETPYGNLSYSTTLRRLKKKFDDTNAALSLRNGKIGSFENFNVSALDTSVSAGNYVLPTTQIRGFKLEQKLAPVDYNIFWGRERFGSFGGLAPGFEKKRESFLAGAQIKHSYEEGFVKGTLAHGYGGARSALLKEDVAGIEFDHQMNPFQWTGDAGFNGEHYGLNLKNLWKSESWRIETKIRDVEKNFFTLVGTPSYLGERGITFSTDYQPLTPLRLSGEFDLYKNRAFLNMAEPDALNQRFYFAVSSKVWEHYHLRMSVSNSRLMGLVSPSIQTYYTSYLSRDFLLGGKRFSPYLNYQFNEAVYRSTPSIDYRNNQVTLGANLGLTKNLSFYTSHLWSFVDETTVKVESRPRAFNAGFNYKLPVPEKLPLSATYGLNYRNEENTESARSFLAGEDTIDHTVNVNYKISSDLRFFLNAQLSHIRFEASRPRQVEANISMGVRSSVDTPFIWNPQTAAVGIVFKDSNGNGLYDEEEGGLQGVAVRCGDKTSVTDSDGYYLLEHLFGKSAFVSLDISSLPKGYVPTTATEKEIEIRQGQPVMVNFGIQTTTQINGFLYNDLNANRTFDRGDAAVPDVTVWLDDKSSAQTDDYGFFNFGRTEPGKHSLRVDMAGLPYTYVTDVPVQQEITVRENEIYQFYFPLRTVKVIGGKIFHDQNGNGRPDRGEPGIPEVTVTVGDVTVTSDSEGNYLLEEIPAGELIARLQPETLPPSYQGKNYGPGQHTRHIPAEGTLQQDLNFWVR